MDIYGVSFDLVGKQPIVLLKTAEGNRFLPIWIGHAEAAAILMRIQGASTPRPMTHDLLSDIIGKLDAEVVAVTVTELRDNTFYASITVQMNGSEIEVDSRPSDAIALAVRSVAQREAREETGLELALPEAPFDVDLHPGEPSGGPHMHLDVRFVARLENAGEIRSPEGLELRWVAPEELVGSDLEEAVRWAIVDSNHGPPPYQSGALTD